MRTTINRIGKYELRAVLARTPMSTVYDGWDSDIARRVAVKLMPLSALDDSEAGEAYARFKRGAQAAGQLNHPNIVGVYDYGETEDYAYLVMEFVNGSTLKAMFDDNQRFALEDTCRIIGSVLEALQYSHDRGVVHRDVKPANIMFTTENQVKITDFGIARLEDSEMTQAGMVIGTPAYMSPEQFLGEKIDLRTDIYSTGVVLYHTLTGERPYEGNLATIMHKVLYGSPLAPSKVSTFVTPALDEVVTRAMARNREDRYSSAAEFNAALQSVRAVAPIGSGRMAGSSGGLPGSLRKSYGGASKSSTRTLILIAAAMFVLVAGGTVGWYGWLKPAPPHASDPVADRARLEQARLEREQELARRQAEEDQARIKQQQDLAARAQEEQAVRLQQEREQALLQQEREQARLQQEVEQARQFAAAQARQKQEQDLARQKQDQELARQQFAASQARQRQDQELARQKQEQDLARQKQAADQARQKLAQQLQPQKPLQEQPRPKQEPDTPAVPSVPPPVYAVTSTSGVAGLVCQSITADTAASFGLDSPQGMVVKGVLAGGAADKAGIREGDVILKIKGVEARDLSGLPKIAAENPAGQSVPVDILRRGDRKTLQLVIDQANH